MNARDAKALRAAPLETPTDLGSDAVRDISAALNALLADMAAQEIPPLLSRSYRTVRRISSPISPALRSHPAKPQICEPATFAGQSASET